MFRKKKNQWKSHVKELDNFQTLTNGNEFGQWLSSTDFTKPRLILCNIFLTEVSVSFFSDVKCIGLWFQSRFRVESLTGMFSMILPIVKVGRVKVFNCCSSRYNPFKILMEWKHGKPSSGKLTSFSLYYERFFAGVLTSTDYLTGEFQKVIQGAAVILIEKLIAFKYDYPWTCRKEETKRIKKSTFIVTWLKKIESGRLT